MAKKEYSKAEAAEILGTTPDAIQKRIQREKIEAFKNDKGQWRVYLDDSEIQQEKGGKTTKSAKKEDKKEDKKEEKPQSAAATAKSESPKEEAVESKPAAAGSSPSCGQSSRTVVQKELPTNGKEYANNDWEGGSTMVEGLVSTAKEMVTSTRERAGEFASYMMEKSEDQRDQVRKVTQMAMETKEAKKTELQAKMAEKIVSVRSKVVTRQDIEELERKIEALNRKIQSKGQ